MRKTIGFSVTALGLAAIACGGGQQGKAKTGGDTTATTTAKTDEAAVFGPLEVGADWQSYTKLNTESSECDEHGNRFCDFYINDVGLEAYKNEDEIPVGTVIVKPSWERNPDRTKSDIPGPIFVMEKRGPDFNPEQENWYYAIHWEKPTEKWVQKLGGPFYWRTPSSKVDYCHKCHNDYDRQLGGVPEDVKAY